MLTPMHNQLDPELYPVGTQIEASGSAIAWSAIWAGATAAIASWVVLYTLGGGLALTSTSPWQGIGLSGTSFRVAEGLWLIVTQWLSFALGGYIAGRLRVRWVSLHTDEVFFRDTAHGLLTWALSIVVVTALALLIAAFTAPDSPPMAVGEVTPAVADALRKTAAAAAFFTAIALLVGGLSASVAAVIGGRLRDRHP